MVIGIMLMADFVKDTKSAINEKEVEHGKDRVFCGAG